MSSGERSSDGSPAVVDGQHAAAAPVAFALVLVAAAAVAYGGTLFYPFVFDDQNDILENRSIRQLSPVWQVFLVDTPEGKRLHSRPVANFSLALNYAVAGLNPFPYHLTNVVIHVLAGLTLFAVVRRTLTLPSLSQRCASSAAPLAFVVAAAWTLHPLQTQAVTYVVQRYESLMGLFYLLSLYGAIRCESSSHPRRWAMMSVAACLLAMGTKEVAVSIPLVILLYDRAFLAGSFREAWRRRRGLYLGLAACWLAMAALLLLSGGRSKWAGFALPVTPVDYAVTQFGVIVHYLRLSFWPYPQVFDYAWPVPQTWGQVLPPAAAILGLLAATLYALVRWPKWGTLGAWFFLILAPTSSVMPIADLAFEHRMYLSLAAVVAAVVFATHGLLTRLFAGRRWVKGMEAALAAAVLLALCAATYARNQVYRSEVAVWQDVVDKVPHNARAHSNLGNMLVKAGRPAEALPHYQQALQSSPRFINAHYNLANTLSRLNKLEDAVSHYRTTLEIDPQHAEAHNNLGVALERQGKVADALSHYEEAVRINPRYAEAHGNLALVLGQQGRLDEMIVHLEKALEIRPGLAAAHYQLGIALIEKNRLDEAVAHLQKALQSNPSFAEAHFHLGRARRLQGDRQAAVDEWQAALRAQPNAVPLLHVLAWELATSPVPSVRNGAEAVRLAERANQLAGGQSPDLLDTLAAACAEAGQFPAAIRHAELALELASKAKDAARVGAISSRLKLYRAGTPFHEAPPARAAK